MTALTRSRSVYQAAVYQWTDRRIRAWDCSAPITISPQAPQIPTHGATERFNYEMKPRTGSK
jgi:hypothetical protein